METGEGLVVGFPGRVGGGGRAMDPYILIGVTQLSMTGMTACLNSPVYTCGPS